MHYNPVSIRLAESTVRDEAERGRLRAVLVESCPTRWNSTLQAQPAGSLLRSLCDNEMQAAAEAAESLGAAVELGDQTIETTGSRCSQLLALTLVELFTPFAGGWKRIADDIACGLEQLGCRDGISIGALLDPLLLAASPIAFVRYPLAAGLKSPLFLVLVGGVLSLAGADAAEPLSSDAELMALLRALAFSAVETIVLGRVFLVGLLEERNFVLARNIRSAIYSNKLRGNSGDTVVAVLGMAHLNGVKQILTSSRVV